MTIKQLFPTQRPALDLNFARQKRLDSRVTFTRGSTATYVGSDGLIKTAASGEARFDHDPTTGESLGLLIEESRTNLLLDSEDFTQWSNEYSMTRSSNSLIAPDGTLTGTKIEIANTGLTQVLKKSASVSTATNTLSVFAKAGNSSSLILGDAQVGAAVTFDLSNGTYTVRVVGLYTAQMIPLPNGWYRCSVTNSLPRILYSPLWIGMKWSTSGSGAVGDYIYIWGAQLEESPYPTSYIPTTTATVTRSADVASLTNSSIYDTDSFTILNEPFGSAAGASTLSLVGAGETPIKRTAVYSQDLTQTQINASVGKTDEFWRWRTLGSDFGINYSTNGQVTVDWGDGTVETISGTSSATHTFTNGSGYHEIGFRLDSGTYFRPRVYTTVHTSKLIAIGPAPETMKYIDGDALFRTCSNLEAFDATAVFGGNGGTTSFANTWRECSKLKGFPFIDSSNITNFNSAWFSCINLTSFPLIDTSSGTDFSNAWYNCNSLTSFPAIDTSSGTNFGSAWYNNNSLTSFPLIDTSSGTNFYQAWQSCSSLTSFPLIDTSSGIDFRFAWANCNSLTSFPLIDTSSGTNFYQSWVGCSSLTSFPAINTSNVTSFDLTWNGCSSLTSFPLIDTSSGTGFSYAWNNCNSLTSFPAIDTSSGTNFLRAWSSCSGLTSFPLINTSSGTNFNSAWTGCSSLTSFPLIDTSSATELTGTWYGCSGLTSFPSLDVSNVTSFAQAWESCSSLTSFPALTMNNATTFYRAWRFCSNLVTFPPNVFDNWTGTPANNCFNITWQYCGNLSATSVENILNSIDTSGQSAPASGVDITISYNTGTGTPSIATAVTNLKSRGWTITLNGVAQ